MNAIIVLCHFCEVHGPKAIFCTQTLRDTKIKNRTHIQEKQQQNCPGCYPNGLSHLLFSNDEENGIIYISAPQPILPEVRILVKQAAIRSLSCEVNFNKDEGVVFFGDTIRGHTLSHIFRLCDNQARGFYQLYSIIILMKDKYTLLNMKPLFAEHLRKISTNLQEYAKYHQEVGKHETFDLASELQMQRSLMKLTGNDDIYAILHSHFTWLLLVGSHYLTEHVTFGNFPWLQLQKSDQYVMTNSKGYRIHEWSQNYLDHTSDNDDNKSLRYVKQILGADQLPIICYCALTGIQIIIRGDLTKTFHLIICLKKIIPQVMHHLIKINAENKHSLKAEYKIISIPPEIAVPKSNPFTYRVDYVDHILTDNKVSIKWPGTMPKKWPDLLTKLVKAVDEPRFTDTILNCRTNALVEEWKNKVACVMYAKNANSQSKLKKILGVQPQDEPLVHYWSTYLIQ